jgi:hypothetical protein
MATKNSLKTKVKSEVKSRSKAVKIQEPAVHYLAGDYSQPSISYEKAEPIEPDEHEIRELAGNLYQLRLENGEPGTPEVDWLRAEAYLKMR